MTHSQNSNGFTLIELAISLMVIGLLIGGVLKGQELIQNARITRVVKNITDYETAILLFRDHYDALPGDLTNPARIPGCDATPAANPCNNTTSTGTGLLNTPVKKSNFWRHLGRAGLLKNVNDLEGGTYNSSAINPFGGYDASEYMARGTPTSVSMNWLYVFDPQASSARISAARSAQIDGKMDDGMPLTGSVRVHHTTLTDPVGHICYDTTTREYIRSLSLHCVMYINAQGMNQ